MFIQLAQELQIPWVLENPYTSRIWLTKHLRRLESAQLLRTDFCGFHTPWKKSTGLMYANLVDVQPLAKICVTTNGRCGFSGRKHIILSGKDAGGTWMTCRAQPYPLALCQQFACVLSAKSERVVYEG